MSYLPVSGVPDEIYIGPTQPSPPVDIWIDTDEPGGTTNAYVLKSGSTMTGTLDVPTITSTVDDIKLGTHINAQNNTIWGLRNPPTGADWAVTKQYVDGGQVTATFYWSGYPGIGLSIQKSAKMVFITGAMYGSGTALALGGDYRMFTVAADSRPSTAFIFPIFWYFDDGNANNHAAYGWVDTAGGVWAKSLKGGITMYSHDLVAFNFAYPIP